MKNISAEPGKMLLRIQPRIMGVPGSGQTKLNAHQSWDWANCWQEAGGFPECVKKVFSASDIKLFQTAKLLLAFPEYKVPLPGGVRASQNDPFGF
jgi:hypothetical protein